jgi:cytochrome c oxidase assembly protein subunit 15
MWLHRFAMLTAGSTLALVYVGALVTSTGSGLAVPDWPLSFGQFFPPMVGGVFYEHGHRMVAATVGLLTLILAVWVQLREPRWWVRRLALAALGAVIVQGLLGGMTVLMGLPVAVSVAHACLAQGFLCLVVAVAECTAVSWRRSAAPAVAVAADGRGALSLLSVGLAVAVYGQLVLGAVMRHTGAGLAIPDFPLSFGRLVPPLASTPVVVHFLHRVGALLVTVLAVCVAVAVARRHPTTRAVVRPAFFVLGLVGLEICLGALTVWSRKAVVPTSAHVAVGAAVLATAVVLALRAHRFLPAPDRSAHGLLRAEEVAA